MLRFIFLTLLAISGPAFAGNKVAMSGTCETLPSTIHITKGKPTHTLVKNVRRLEEFSDYYLYLIYVQN